MAAIKIVKKVPPKAGTPATAKVASAIPPERHHRTVPVRVPVGLLNQIDNAIASRTVRIPRNTWMLDAFVEKLERLR